MIDDGFTCVDIRQGYQTLSEPTKKILKVVTQGKLHHGGHPVLRWNAGCAMTVDDKRDNIMFSKPERAKSTNRIDGIAATTNAMVRAMVAPPPPKYQMIFV
jgi:phage terminase large subunit-like protein